MARYVGGIVSKAGITPNGSSASGIWSLSDHARFLKAGTWPGQALYSFSTFTFTNAGVTGVAGPTLSQCKNAYGTATYPWLNNTALFNMVNQGIQIWTVPSSGNYIIDAYGAKGGNSSHGGGGNGARIMGTFALTQGQKLRILVGQMGGTGGGPQGGGGGGTFVMKETGSSTSDIFVIAGGGGGAYYSSYSSGQPHGSATSTAGYGWSGGYSRIAGAAGTGGYGGGVDGTGTGGGGGGGLLGGGSSGNYNAGADEGSGGLAFINGGNAVAGETYPGGFGGGGSGDWYYWTGGGGGGGYNGGGGGHYYGYGGGGGSFNNGTNQTNTSGANSNHGKVIITKL